MLYDNYGFMITPERADPYEGSASRFYTPEEGLLRGNLFKKEYEPYKNLTYLTLTPRNEREKLLLKVAAYDFAINDLALYLDLKPDDKGAMHYFQQCLHELEKVRKEYTNHYGPLELDEVKKDHFNWLEKPWPWDKDGGEHRV